MSETLCVYVCVCMGPCVFSTCASVSVCLSVRVRIHMCVRGPGVRGWRSEPVFPLHKLHKLPDTELPFSLTERIIFERRQMLELKPIQVQCLSFYMKCHSEEPP